MEPLIVSSPGATNRMITVNGSAMGGWVAYNDCVHLDGQLTTNISTYECYTNDTTGPLVDFNTGLDVPVSVLVTTSGEVAEQTSNDIYGAETEIGTDAYDTFHGFVDIAGGERLGTAASSVMLTFTGLNPDERYSFATTANRANAEYSARVTKFSLNGVEGAANASTDGVTVNDNLSVSFLTGYNTENGYVARWEAIDPGADGEFTVRFDVDGEEDMAYGPAAFVLQEEEGDHARITIASAMSEFSSLPGAVSDEQSYTVSGRNLAGDISINAPADFEISAASASGFGASLVLPQIDGVVAATRIYVHFSRLAEGTSAGNITHSSEGAPVRNLPVSGTAALPPNQAPEQPLLVRPANAGANVTLPPTLEVTVNDPESDAMDVSFFGRQAGAGTGEDFTLVALPDVQNELQFAPAMFISQTNWIVAHKEDMNIVFATSLGDLVNSPSDAAQYDNADAAMDILDEGGVPYSVSPGNHDQMSGTLYSTYFGVDRFSGKPWYGGAIDSSNYNNYSLFSASGMDFILINLQYNPTTAQLTWADNLLKANPGRRGIVVSHAILNTDNSWNYQAVYTNLKSNPNLFLMLCGHMHSGNDGAAYRAELGDDGHTIHIVMADYQDMTNGNGYLRILRFSPADDTIYMTTYSPYIDGSITSSPDQMNLAYDMDSSSGPYEELASYTGVPSGGNAGVTWTGLSADTTYEWYARADDGEKATSSPVWSFTTTGAAVNHAPVISEGEIGCGKHAGRWPSE